MPYSAGRSNSSGQSTRMARAPSPSGASKKPASRVNPPTDIDRDSRKGPASPAGYRGSTTVALHPSRASAGGNAPRTSASPPVFENGRASEPIMRTDLGALRGRARDPAFARLAGGREPAALRAAVNYATRGSDIRPGTSRSGMGGAAKRRTS